MLSELVAGVCLSFNAFYGVAAFRPTGTRGLGYYDPYSPEKVVSFIKGAVPPLTNFFGFLESVMIFTGWS